ncbi:hypothetical protein BDZ97DRAFT_1792436 [Flammula alnicola]|nr:hypothetical protein BDZ97DRAFT_1879428 [Flammula alnicola]KAF8970205.1 hypothetical protein BDZ97DRAFT_1792436 [Flammula alnicola]
MALAQRGTSHPSLRSFLYQELFVGRHGRSCDRTTGRWVTRRPQTACSAQKGAVSGLAAMRGVTCHVPVPSLSSRC